MVSWSWGKKCLGVAHSKWMPMHVQYGSRAHLTQFPDELLGQTWNTDQKSADFTINPAAWFEAMRMMVAPVVHQFLVPGGANPVLHLVMQPVFPSMQFFPSFSPLNSLPFSMEVLWILPKNHSWLVVYLPLWKIWVRQLGWWHSQYIRKVIIQSCSKPTSIYIYTCMMYDGNHMMDIWYLISIYIYVYNEYMIIFWYIRPFSAWFSRWISQRPGTDRASAVPWPIRRRWSRRPPPAQRRACKVSS